MHFSKARLTMNHPGMDCENCSRRIKGLMNVYIPRVIITKGKHKGLRTSISLCAKCSKVDVTTIKDGRYIFDPEPL